jgi:hypothetical protein
VSIGARASNEEAGGSTATAIDITIIIIIIIIITISYILCCGAPS